jgi:hypothetical protein
MLYLVLPQLFYMSYAGLLYMTAFFCLSPLPSLPTRPLRIAPCASSYLFVALTQKLEQLTDGLCLCGYGDGQTSSSPVSTAVQMAAWLQDEVCLGA